LYPFYQYFGKVLYGIVNVPQNLLLNQNSTMIAALVDRLTFRSHVLNMNGESFRKSYTTKVPASSRNRP